MTATDVNRSVEQAGAGAPDGASARRSIVFQWEVSSLFGWGVYGLNLMLAWARDPEVVPVTSCSFRERDIMVTPAQQALLAPLLQRSKAMHEKLAAAKGRTVEVSTLVLHAMGNELQFAR